MGENTVSFPPGFLWGSALSAHQTEGNNIHSDWWAWERSERRKSELRKQNLNPGDYESGDACDFYNRYASDFEIAKSLHHNAIRISVEWARIEPQAGAFDRGALDHYRQMLESAHALGLKTFVTLHHYTLPSWFAQLGGFERSENIPAFIRYATVVATALDKVVDFYITINEPEIYASHAYLYGKWPPQRRNFFTALAVLRNLISAHRRVAREIRKTSRKLISMSYHISDLQPTGIFSTPATNLLDYLLNFFVLDRTVDTCDFIGLNYYNHAHVGLLGRRHTSHSKHAVSDLGWGIHPEGLERVLLKLKRFGKPIYITENGLADAADTRRAGFIRSHLAAAARAMDKGVDLRGYLHWSLTDNFEWHHGFGPRFGLIGIDYATQSRTVRNSARVFAEIARTNKLIA